MQKQHANIIVSALVAIVLLSGISNGYCDDDSTDNMTILEKLAESGNAEAQYQLAMFLSEWADARTVNYEKAYYWLEKSAQQGHAQAQYKFGYFHTIRRPGLKEINQEEASKWYLISAKNGEPKAQFAYVSANGKSISKNEAINWLISAAENDLAFAQYTLAGYYFNGYNNENRKDQKDYESAYAWLMITAKRNDLWNLNSDGSQIEDFKERLSPEQLLSADNKIEALNKKIDEKSGEYQAKRITSWCKMYDPSGPKLDDCIVDMTKTVTEAKKNGQMVRY